MENKYIKMLECNEYLKNHIKDFIEIFVDYYGEENRKYIEEKFNSALIIGYLPEDTIRIILHRLEKDKVNMEYEKIVRKSKLPLTKEQLFGEDDYYSLGFSDSKPISRLKSFYEGVLLGEEGRKQKAYEQMYLDYIKDIMSYEEFIEFIKTQKIPEECSGDNIKVHQMMLGYNSIKAKLRQFEYERKFVVNLLKEIYPDITIENIEEKIINLPEIIALLKDYEDAKKEYQEFKAKYSKYYNMLEHNENLRNTLKDKYNKQYLKEILDFIPEEYKSDVQYISSTHSFILNFQFNCLFGRTLTEDCLLDYFSIETTEKLNDENTSNYERDIIQRNRIKCFNILGIDLGTSYENYANSPKVRLYQERLNNILQKKEELYNEFNIEYYNNIYPQKSIIEEKKKKGILKIDPKNALYMQTIGNTGYVHTVMTKDENGQYQPINEVVVVCYDNGYYAETDHDIIHELNHLYELSFLGVQGEYFETVSGWDFIKESINSLEKPTEKNREFELFNEIINEKIAKEITKRMVDKGITVFLEEGANLNTITDYDDTNYLVEDFFNTYKKEILASRRDNNIQVIFDAVGKENFYAMNELFSIHDKYLGDVIFDSLMIDIEKGKVTDKTEIYKKLINKRDAILEKMKEQYRIYIKDKERPTEKDFKEQVGFERIANGIERVNPKDLTIVQEESVKYKE